MHKVGEVGQKMTEHARKEICDEVAIDMLEQPNMTEMAND